MNFNYFGHSCFSVEINGCQLLFDPFIQGNPLAAHIDPDQIQADFILVSHGHSDHIEDCVRMAKRTGALVIASFEVAVWLSKQGIPAYHPMNIGGKKSFKFGTVKAVNAVHSSQLPDGSDGGNPMGYVILSDTANFYYSGDTALTMDMQLIKEMTNLDFCILPIGDNFTMDAADAARAAQMAGAKKVIGVHYNSFGFIEIDTNEAKAAFESKGLELLLPEIGSSIII
jgi:L-ascorbate metabolism protein UlaG (beta-lactamase superfamily)